MLISMSVSTLRAQAAQYAKIRPVALPAIVIHAVGRDHVKVRIKSVRVRVALNEKGTQRFVAAYLHLIPIDYAA